MKAFIEKKSFLFTFQGEKKENQRKHPFVLYNLGGGGNNQLKLKLKSYCSENSRTLTYPV